MVTILIRGLQKAVEPLTRAVIEYLLEKITEYSFQYMVRLLRPSIAVWKQNVKKVLPDPSSIANLTANLHDLVKTREQEGRGSPEILLEMIFWGVYEFPKAILTESRSKYLKLKSQRAQKP
jgi:hypothetical protein